MVSVFFRSWRANWFYSASYTFSHCIASLDDLGSAVIFQVRSDLFSTFEINLFARSTVKELNFQIKSRSGLVNLLVKKNCPRKFLASHLTLQEAGLLVSPSVFVFKRSEPSPMYQAFRRILRGVSTRSPRHSQTFVDMAGDHAQSMAHLQVGQKTSHRPMKSDGLDIDCSSSLNTVVSRKRKVFPALAMHLALQEDSAAAAPVSMPPSSAATSALLCTPVLAISAVQPRCSDRSQGGMLSAYHPQKKRRKAFLLSLIHC